MDWYNLATSIHEKISLKNLSCACGCFDFIICKIKSQFQSNKKGELKIKNTCLSTSFHSNSPYY